MSFERPFFLLFSFFAFFPFLIYFLIKARKKTLKFPSLVIFKNWGADEIKKINYLKYLVFVLRSFFILFIVMAFAGPCSDIKFFGKFGQFYKKTPLSLIVLLDNSYSMEVVEDNETLLSKNIRRIENILHSLDSDSQVAIISFSEKPALISGFLPVQEALKKINSLNSVLYAGTNYEKAFTKAFQLFLPEDRNKKVIFLASDNSLNGKANSLAIPGDINAFSVKDDGQPLNFWFEDIKVLPYGDSGFKVKGVLCASNLFTGNVNIRYCNYFSCGNWRIIHFDKSERKEFEFDFKNENRSGYIEISEDALTKDNKYYISLKRKFNKILILYSAKDIFLQGKGAFFIKEIFDALNSKENKYSIDAKNTKNLTKDDLKIYSKIIAILPHNEPIIDEMISLKIPFVYIPDNIEKDYLFFEKFPHIAKGKVFKGDYHISDFKKGEEAYLKKFYAIKQDILAYYFDIVIEAENSYPGVVKISGNPSQSPFTKVGSEDSFAFLFDIDINNSNIALKPFFISLLNEFLTIEQVEKNDFFIGEKPFLKEEPKSIYRIEKEDIKIKEQNFICNVPGNYRVDYDGEKFYFSCNLDGKIGESSLKKLDKTPWRLLPQTGYLSEFEKLVYASNISGFFFLFAILIFLLENFILWKYF